MAGPECLPFKTVEDVLEFEPENYKLFAATETLVRRVPIASDAPKTILCHDMRGGYLQDRFVQGSPDADSYRFYHWQYIDAFIYFSHNLLTVPPPGWTNTAHRHGVQMMGTLITEWDDGKKRCHQIIESEETYKKFADKMVAITQHYGMDGWLVNIENVVEAGKVQLLCDFVAYLTKRLHDVVPGSQVIWYDSVIKTGGLKWQDEVNEKNSMFFDVCDGIFLNYNWKDASLRRSKELASSRGRAMDVYVGVDVFGRGCLGGGGFNTVEALTAIRQHNMSAAIFAMGWVYETQGEANFLQNENRFWRLLHHLLPVRVLASSYLPFSTSFCQGFGQKYYSQGLEVDATSWHNLGLQELQPSLTNAQFEGKTPSTSSMALDTEMALLGGSCLKLSANPVPSDGSPVIYRLFCMEFEIKEPVVISYSFKCDQAGLDIFLQCEVSCGNKTKKFYFKGDNSDKKSESDSLATVFNPTPAVSFVTKYPSLKQALGNNGNDQWTTRYYRVDPSQTGEFTLTSVSVGLFHPSAPGQQTEAVTVRLGQIQIIPESCLDTEVAVSEVSVLKKDKDDGTKTLTWKCSKMSAVKYFNVHYTQNGVKHFGHSNCSTFVIGNGQSSTTDQGDVTQPASLSVVIQPVLKLGFALPLSSCPSVELKQ
ncbi:cytosolic endo-beta-N-acetylglucosaminidase-like [Mizuhopecten yessoensis]|uniref:Cytosolic endo-beta-N-acetylglucosaminidase n=1 Tax=Mizuhopecten yessoensis TaxID=6573 RepID=A0A210PFH3_MIZYE|nr:cytosolic endo-beta-N-acetylglucosaminidase-like [Mizuhopecten yessoensis]OWF35240.1 Cytosolic endo-beta-N-acetylglucosaminidase [Mizuhopecten yessoensis]